MSDESNPPPAPPVTQSETSSPGKRSVVFIGADRFAVEQAAWRWYRENWPDHPLLSKAMKDGDGWRITGERRSRS